MTKKTCENSSLVQMIQTVKQFFNKINSGGFYRFNILLYLRFLSSVKLKVVDGPNFGGILSISEL